MRAAARVVTGCPLSTPSHAVMAEAGQLPVSVRRDILKARLLTKAYALPLSDPLRITAERTPPPRRLRSVTGWRETGREMLTSLNVAPPIETILPDRLPPWTPTGPVTFTLGLGAPLPPGAPDSVKRQTAQVHLASLPQCATWAWTDGSASGGIADGGAGALISYPDDTTEELRTPAGRLCSSFRAELVALHSAATFLMEHPLHPSDPIVFCTDSLSALTALRSGPAAQRSLLGVEIWKKITSLANANRPIHLQWVPSHCGIGGNERADVLAREAAALPQEAAPLDLQTIYRAASRRARQQTIRRWPQGWYRELMGEHLPRPVTIPERSTAVDVHQTRAGHWSGSTQYIHRIGRAPTPDCAGCTNLRCPAASCRACGEAADTPHHILLECPALMGLRLRHLGTIFPAPEEVRIDEVVAAFLAAFRALQSRQATPR